MRETNRTEEPCPCTICAVLSPPLALERRRREGSRNFLPVNPFGVCPLSLPAGLSAPGLQHRQWAKPPTPSEPENKVQMTVDGARSPVRGVGATSLPGALSASLAASLPSCCSRAVAGRPIDGACSLTLSLSCDAALNSPACSLCYKSGTAAFQGARASGARAGQIGGNVAPGLCTFFWQLFCSSPLFLHFLPGSQPRIHFSASESYLPG